jgi:hypothetical protein
VETQKNERDPQTADCSATHDSEKSANQMKKAKILLVLSILVLPLVACNEEEEKDIPHASNDNHSLTVDDPVHSDVIAGARKFEKTEDCKVKYDLDSISADGEAVHARLVPENPDDPRCKTKRHDVYIGQSETIAEEWNEGEAEKYRMTVNQNEFKQENERDGSYSQFGGNWPENEFTRQIPKPDIPFDSIAITGGKARKLAIIFQKAPIEKAKKYAETLRKYGYTIALETKENIDIGFLSYEAKNTAGYQVEFTCIGMCTLGLEVP